VAKDPIVDALNPIPKSEDSDREDRIRRRAYELWDAAGQPGGREHEHWFTAESEETSRDNHEPSMGTPMVPSKDAPVIRSDAAASKADQGDPTLSGDNDASAAPKTAGAPVPATDTSKSRVANRDLEGPRKAGTTPRPTTKPMG
jgi:hypothetical protein